MRILYLGYQENAVPKFLEFGNKVDKVQERFAFDPAVHGCYDLVVSYGYRYILKPDFVAFYRNRIINLHISYLPWNRGVHPNIWSAVNGTANGVSIHYIDEGVDTGPILVQDVVRRQEQDTLSSSYDKLKGKIENLFIENWNSLKNGSILPKQNVGGDFHNLKDTKKYLDLIDNRWDMRVSEFLEKVHKNA